MKIISSSVLEMAENAVERGKNNLPVAWPVFHAGDNVVTRANHAPVNINLTKDDLASVVDYYQSHGSKIPLDCRHVVSNLAGKLKLDEAELLKKMPRYSGVAGFGKLELRGDTLYLSEVEYLPIGEEVMKAGQFRYFSPTMRGLDGKSPLRITSVALTNEPMMSNVADLAASELDDDDLITPGDVREAIEAIQKKEELMPEVEKKMPPVPEPPDKAAELLKNISEVLGEEVTADNLKEVLSKLKANSAQVAELSEKVEKLECSEEARNLDAAKAKGLKRGVVTPAILATPFMAKMSSVELSEYCNGLPDGCAAPVGTLELSETPVKNENKTNNLTPRQKAMAEAKTYDMKGF